MKFRIPSKDEPGHLRRQALRVAFLSAEDIETRQEKMLDWLAVYVVGDNPREILLDASENEIDELMDAITEAAKPSPKDSENSESG